MRLVFFGTPEFAVPALQRLAAAHEVALVVTQPDRPTGRAQTPTPPAVAIAARALGLPIRQPSSPNARGAVAVIRACRPDVLVLVAYGRLIEADLLALAPAGVVNLHPSLLPAYRGAAPIQAAIAEGRTETGVTLIRLDAGLDAGPIIQASKVSIGPDETTPRVSGRLALAGADVLVATLPGWVAGQVAPRAQDPAQATVTRPLTRADGDLDPRRPARELYDRWRAFQPWPGVTVRAGALPLKLLDLRLQASAPGPPGQVVAGDGVVWLACGTGALEIRSLQPTGRHPMAAAEFARGYHHLLDVRWGDPPPTPTPPLVRPFKD